MALHVSLWLSYVSLPRCSLVFETWSGLALRTEGYNGDLLQSLNGVFFGGKGDIHF